MSFLHYFPSIFRQNHLIPWPPCSTSPGHGAAALRPGAAPRGAGAAALRGAAAAGGSEAGALAGGEHRTGAAGGTQRQGHGMDREHH